MGPNPHFNEVHKPQPFRKDSFDKMKRDYSQQPQFQTKQPDPSSQTSTKQSQDQKNTTGARNQQSTKIPSAASRNFSRPRQATNTTTPKQPPTTSTVGGTTKKPIAPRFFVKRKQTVA